MVPPIYLISPTVFHLEVRSVRGVLVIPKWPSALFWPTVFPMGGLRPSVLQVVEFSDPSFVFAPVHDGLNTIFCPFRFKYVCRFSFIVGWFCSRLLTFCFQSLFTFIYIWAIPLLLYSASAFLPTLYSVHLFFVQFIAFMVFHASWRF